MTGGGASQGAALFCFWGRLIILGASVAPSVGFAIGAFPSRSLLSLELVDTMRLAAKSWVQGLLALGALPMILA